jgi:hypothetical protein
MKYYKGCTVVREGEDKAWVDWLRTGETPTGYQIAMAWYNAGDVDGDEDDIVCVDDGWYYHDNGCATKVFGEEEITRKEFDKLAEHLTVWSDRLALERERHD